jgi:cytochrome c oxidase cbb3-type subunit III
MSEQKETMQPFDGIKDSHKKPPVYFNVLFYGLILWGVLFSAWFILSGWSSHTEFQEKMTTYEQEHGLSQK